MARSSSGARAPARRAPPPTSSGSITFSRAVRHGRRAASWKTKPMSRFIRATAGRSPSTESAPDVGGMRSAMTRSKVDLPQPDGPRRVRKPPRRTDKLTLSRAVTEPRSVTKRTVTFSQTTATSLSLPGACGSLRTLAAWLAMVPYPSFGRTSFVASRIAVVMTSSSLGGPAENCLSSS